MKQKILSICVLIILLFPTISFAGELSSGAYERIQPAQPTGTSGKIEVIEIFWYGCPHCYAFEPYLERWLNDKPDDVVFRRLPGILGKTWIAHAKAFFTAEKLGILEEIHAPLFDAIHKQRQNIKDEKGLTEFFSRYGVPEDEFSKIFNSEEINTQIKQAFIMGKRYGVTGVPSIVVNGKYRTSPSIAGSYDKVLLITDELIKRERK